MADPSAELDLTGYPSVLKLDEVAGLLRLTRQATSRLIRIGRLPGFRVGGEWRVLRSQLEDVMAGQWQPATSSEPRPQLARVLPELAHFPPVLKLEEVASLLRVNRQVAGRLVCHGRLPGFRAGGEWRVLRSRVQDLITGRWTPPPVVAAGPELRPQPDSDA
jgi:excisionase family DNA binding protein